MKYLTLTISDISRLNKIQKSIAEQKPLTVKEQTFLSEFLLQIPSPKVLLLDKLPLDETFNVNVWDTIEIEAHLKEWIKLFDNIPGYDAAPGCYIVDHNSRELLRKNVIMTAAFAPTLAYNYIVTNEAFEVHLKDNGTASFWFPTFEDAEQYPNLYNFKGTWKEAYLLLIETLKKGWPMEEFPEELQQFLKNNT
jgi:hypothetical protein